MIGRVLRFIRLPLLLILLYAGLRFWLGAAGKVPYAPRGNAMFSVLGVTLISAFYFGALARRVGGLGWGGTALVGWSLGMWAQILIFSATYLSYALNIETSYFRHWDALNAHEGTVVPMAQAMKVRAGALVVAPLISIVPAALGRLLSGLLPEPSAR